MSYSPQAVTIAAPRSSDDKATWALIAVVAVLLAGGVGWLVARQSAPTWSDVESSSRVAAGEGALAGRTRGYAQGAKAGRRESKLQTQYDTARSTRGAYSNGWNSGYQDGRAQAEAKRDGFDPYIGGASSALGANTSALDSLALDGDDLFTDVPGYATSSLSATGVDGTPGYRAPLGASAGNMSDYYRGSSY